MARRYDPDTIAYVIIFARRLREARAASGLTHARLAQRAGLHHTEISKLERALTDPRLSTVMRLAYGLRIPASTLVEDRAG